MKLMKGKMELKGLLVIKIICYILGLIFLLSGFYYLIYPENLFSNLENYGIDTKDEIVFWKTLTFAYMITISALAVVVAHNVALYWRVLPVLVLAKLSSSLTGLKFYLNRGSDLGVLIFAVDFPLAVLFAVMYVWVLKVKG